MQNISENTTPAWEKLGIHTTTLHSVPKILDLARAMPAKMTVCLVGETGIGKTPIVQQWAKANGGTCHVLNFAHMSQEDVGMAMFSDDGTSYGYVAPEWLLRVNADAAKYGLSVLFIDEWNRGDKALVNALFGLNDERRLHHHTLHENVLIVAAMNPSDGTYIVNNAERDHAVRKRLNFVFVQPDFVQWLQFAEQTGFHPQVINFVRAAPIFFYDTNTRNVGRVFPCPSNWEKVSNVFKAAEATRTPLTADYVRTMVEGQIGTAAATKLFEYLENEDTLIDPQQIVYQYMSHPTLRQRVLRLLGAHISPVDGSVIHDNVSPARIDTVKAVGDSVGVYLFTQKPELEEVVDHISNFLADLPLDLRAAVISQHWASIAAAQQGGGGYVSKLNNHMTKHERGRAAMSEISAAQARARNAMTASP